MTAAVVALVVGAVALVVGAVLGAVVLSRRGDTSAVLPVVEPTVVAR